MWNVPYKLIAQLYTMKWDFYLIFIVVKREDEAADDAKADEDKEVADRPAPGLGGTNVRFPSKLEEIKTFVFLRL